MSVCFGKCAEESQGEVFTACVTSALAGRELEKLRRGWRNFLEIERLMRMAMFSEIGS